MAVLTVCIVTDIDEAIRGPSVASYLHEKQTSRIHFSSIEQSNKYHTQAKTG